MLIEHFKDYEVCVTLLYRGSIHGWYYKDFHDNCDNKGPTISLFQIKEGDCVGGFTKALWSTADEDEWKKDESAIIFNLT